MVEAACTLLLLVEGVQRFGEQEVVLQGVVHLVVVHHNGMVGVGCSVKVVEVVGTGTWMLVVVVH